MGRVIWLLGLLIALQAEAVEVVATGVGQTEAVALANAREQALGAAAGTFVIGRRTLDESGVASRVDEYLGGRIRGYTVIDTQWSGEMHQVTIRADVDADKTNVVLESRGEIDPAWAGQIAAARAERERLAAIVGALDDPQLAFAVTLTHLSFRNQGDATEVEVEASIRWQPKWIADVDALLATVGRPVAIAELNTDRFGWVAALSAVVNPVAPLVLITAAWVADKTPSFSNEYAICETTSQGATAERCREIRVPFGRVAATHRMKLSGELEGAGKSVPIDGGIVESGADLFREVRSGQKISFAKGGVQTFLNPGLLLYRDGEFRKRFRFVVPSTDVENATAIRLSVTPVRSI